jgi:hypothetical protein
MPSWDDAFRSVLANRIEDRVVITGGGVDVDSAEAVARRGFDLLVCLLGLTSLSLDEDLVSGALVERVHEWNRW